MGCTTNIVPASNTELARAIVKSGGCLVSEYSIGTTVSNFNYPKRDRIQAALSEAILVIEADEKSGTMFAVNTAYKNDRKVFQIKGNDNEKIKFSIDLDSKNDLSMIENSINSYVESSDKLQISFFD